MPLHIPKIIDNYNHHMGRVDIADQQRGYYNTQLSAHRTWMPLFFWLLDTAVVNSYLVCKAAGLKMSHSEFRLKLVWDLIGLAYEKEKEKESRRQTHKRTHQDDQLPSPPSSSKKPRVTKNSYDLAPSRLLPGNHLPKFQENHCHSIACFISVYLSVTTQSIVVCSFPHFLAIFCDSRQALRRLIEQLLMINLMD
jgi:hypothetical protein